MSTRLEASVRDIVLCGHGSTGKTSLVDRILESTHEVEGRHSVDDGTSVTDFEPEERLHHYSVDAALAHFRHRGVRFNCIDAPGYPDFIGQTISAMRGADTAVIVIDAHAGIAVNTRRVYAEAERAGLGRIIVINKMDIENVDYPSLLDSIRQTFGAQCIPFNVPCAQGGHFDRVVGVMDDSADRSGALVDPGEFRQPLIEAAIEADEAWMERYFDGEIPSRAELADLIPHAVAAGALVPIVSCSIKSGVGFPELLDALAVCSVPPSMMHRSALGPDGQPVEIDGDPDGPLAAQVFKTRIDPFVQKLSYIRVYNGTLHKDELIHLTNGSRKGVKIGQLLEVQGAELRPVDEAHPGDIVAVAKIEYLHTGVNEGELKLPEIDFPEPMVGVAIRPKSRNDEAKLAAALHKLVEEDPTVRIEHDPQTHEVVLRGMSDLHLCLLQERLLRRDHVEIETHEPQIPYHETIQSEAEGSFRHKKQTGGRGQFAEVHVRVFPLPRGTDIEQFATKSRFPHMKHRRYLPEYNFLWIDSIVGGSIPGNFLPAIEKGFLERLNQGVLAGCQIQNLCVEVFFGKYHPVDSSEAAFKIAGSKVLRDVFKKANPVLLEPMAELEITVPEGMMGDVYSDLSTRRGQVLGAQSDSPGYQTICATVPLAEVMTYARTLSSMTGGQGSYSMRFSHYDAAPPNVQMAVLRQSGQVEEDDS
ncbi:elongation factor G [Blastopirellula retiformator]|uniref:Elongation factor G n=1 Tax=Blastopirellula retiformator TaxID=2527970 RepID=A0A5C5VML1_9BACT|nr:elongation factor G [Blastopirellula retiformator]TWT39768.1 Elongation factor G [Blastopirellula retiformator]